MSYDVILIWYYEIIQVEMHGVEMHDMVGIYSSDIFNSSLFQQG